MTYIGKILSGNRVTIPEKYMKILKAKEGDPVVIEFAMNHFGVLVRPAEVMPKEPE